MPSIFCCIFGSSQSLPKTRCTKCKKRYTESECPRCKPILCSCGVEISKKETQCQNCINFSMARLEIKNDNIFDSSIDTEKELIKSSKKYFNYEDIDYGELFFYRTKQNNIFDLHKKVQEAKNVDVNSCVYFGCFKGLWSLLYVVINNDYQKICIISPTYLHSPLKKSSSVKKYFRKHFNSIEFIKTDIHLDGYSTLMSSILCGIMVSLNASIEPIINIASAKYYWKNYLGAINPIDGQINIVPYITYSPDFLDNKDLELNPYTKRQLLQVFLNSIIYNTNNIQKSSDLVVKDVVYEMVSKIVNQERFDEIYYKYNFPQLRNQAYHCSGSALAYLAFFLYMEKYSTRLIDDVIDDDDNCQLMREVMIDYWEYLDDKKLQFEKFDDFLSWFKNIMEMPMGITGEIKTIIQSIKEPTLNPQQGIYGITVQSGVEMKYESYEKNLIAFVTDFQGSYHTFVKYKNKWYLLDIVENCEVPIENAVDSFRNVVYFLLKYN